MPSQKPRAALSQMVDPMSDDDLDQTPQTEFDNSADMGAENLDPVPAPRVKVAAAKAKATRAPAPRNTAAGKVTKARPTTRRVSGQAAPAKKPAKGGKRTALAERNAPNASDTEEVDGFQEEMPPPKRNARRQAVEEETVDEISVAEIKAAQKQRARPTKAIKPKASKRAPSAEPTRTIQAPHADPMDLEPSTVDDVTVLPLEPLPQRPSSRVASQARPSSKTRQPSVPRSRAGSVSDADRRAHDPALRRKLGEITQKFENLDIKYRHLKNIGMRDAESNFDKLRKGAEQRARDQDDIIASQKKEILRLRGGQTDSQSLQAKVALLESANKKISAENSRLLTEVRATGSACLDAQNEVKSLTAKLAAARESLKAAEEAAKAATAAAKAQGSASKTNTQQQKAATAALSGDVAVLKLKEELYSDLTGLMVRNVKKIDGEDVFDCIQTGRNGTLHFHLSIPPLPANPEGNGNGFDDLEFEYTPLLDEKNDRELLSILPDYLIEEICFPRSSTARFYARVLDCMNKKVVLEADD